MSVLDDFKYLRESPTKDEYVLYKIDDDDYAIGTKDGGALIIEDDDIYLRAIVLMLQAGIEITD